MPLHDWSWVDPGLFHDFHQSWSIRIKDALNAGLLPKGIFSLVEQCTPKYEPDVLAVERRGSQSLGAVHVPTGSATIAPPALATRFVHRGEKEAYAAKANRIVVRHRHGDVIAIIEIVSPGNKDGRPALRDFVKKTLKFLRAGVHVLIIDILPPTRRDPHGIHQAIWRQLEDDTYTPPPGKDRILVSYKAGDELTADVVSVGVGDDLPDMPLYLDEDWSIATPLESTYRTPWDASPEDFREAIETEVVGEDE